MKMKMFFTTLMIAAASLNMGLQAQTPSTATLVVERQDLDERFKQIASDIQSLQESNMRLMKKLEKVSEDMDSLREQMAKSKPDLATQDDVKKLAEKILDLDTLRKSDNKVIEEKIIELAKLIAKAPPVVEPKHTVKPPVQETKTPDKEEKGYKYSVKKGDTLVKIVAACNKEGIKVTAKQIETANPGLNVSRLQIGQEIFIPSSAP
jgi:septal ring factor EnvC (AmiA/AmiB activator)